jgi:hypothetical protein
MARPTGIIEFIQKNGENGAVFSAVSSMLPQNSLLTGKITGKIIRNCYYSSFKAQYLLSKADFTCKINREFF